MENALALIGAGRVGRALGRSLRELGWKIGAVVTRNAMTARKAVRFIGAGQPHGVAVREILASPTILIAVPDDAVVHVAAELARIGAEELRGKVVLHTSGALDSTALAALKQYGAAVGGLHPLQTFSGVGVPPLEGRVFAIEGDTAALRIARQIARSLGGSPVRIAGNKKAFYHAAAAMAAGYVLTIEEAATQLLISVGMTRHQATRALLPLTRQVLENFERLGARPAWTGPLSRGDYRIVEAHLKALQESPQEFAAAYDAVARLAARLLANDARGMLDELSNISGDKKAKIAGGNA